MTLKLITLAASATLALTSVASADSFFQHGSQLERRTTLDLGLVSSEGAGIISIYDYHRGEQGKLLGTQTVNAGPNYNTRVGVGTRPLNDVIAVLTVNGQIVASRDYDIDRN